MAWQAIRTFSVFNTSLLHSSESDVPVECRNAIQMTQVVQQGFRPNSVSLQSDFLGQCSLVQEVEEAGTHVPQQVIV